jgi:hypothetical protein
MRRANTIAIAVSLLLSASRAAPAAEEGLRLKTTGLAPSRVDPQGCLVEDWGAVKLCLDGVPIAASGPLTLEEVLDDGIVPAVRAAVRKGSVRVELTAYRAPAFPAGIDVLSVRLEETEGKEAHPVLSVELPEGARIGERTAQVGGRAVLALPPRSRSKEKLREWGYCDEASPLPGWARPEGECDPAFRNIRAGLGGVPIIYRFQVAPGAAACVVLGFCESHHTQAGQRPFICNVEGAPGQEVDPIARWGRHKPGAIPFAARDANSDGLLEVAVLPKPGAPDVNPILNVLWLFPAGPAPDLAAVIAGKLNAAALRRVDVGGEGDQSIYPPGKIEYSLTLAPRGSETLQFLVAPRGATVPVPDRSAWTPASLLAAARAVWADWKER